VREALLLMAQRWLDQAERAERNSTAVRQRAARPTVPI